MHLSEQYSVKMIAHRGLSALEQENTHASFVAAGNRSFFGIETDVHLTSDGQFVLMHDHKTGRVSETDLVIRETDYATLRALQLNERGGRPGRTDIRIPNLEEYVEICKRYDKTAVLELKPLFEPAQLEQILDTFRQKEWLDRAVFISFNFENLARLNAIAPSLPKMFLTGEWEDILPEKLAACGMGLDIYYPALTEERVGACRAAGVPVNVWTVDSRDKAEELVSWGVAYITTNILE